MNELLPSEVLKEIPRYAVGGGRRDEVQAKALGRGLVVVEQCDVPGKIITCDFDNTVTPPAQMDKVIARLYKTLYAIRDIKYATTSVSSCGIHVYCVLAVARPLYVRVALAAALGSDPVREAINSHRLTRADEEIPVACFEKPDVIPGLVDFLAANALPNEYRVHLPGGLNA